MSIMIGGRGSCALPIKATIPARAKRSLPKPARILSSGGKPGCRGTGQARMARD